MPGAARAFWFFADDVARAVAPADLEGDQATAVPATVTQLPDGYRVDVTASRVIRDLALLVDRAHPDATVDDLLVTLLPGESASFSVRCPVLDDPLVLTRQPVLRHAGDLPAR